MTSCGPPPHDDPEISGDNYYSERICAKWIDWIPLGVPPCGGIKGDPGVRSRRPDTTHVFVRGTDNRLWHKAWDRDHWTDWQYEGEFILGSSPGVDSMNSEHLHVFARGQDGQLHIRSWQLSTGWLPWKPLGVPPCGGIKGDPDVRSRRPDTTHVFVRGTDNRLWHKAWDRDHWTDWQYEGEFMLGSSPGVDSMNPDHLHIFARGQDGQLHIRSWVGKKPQEYVEYFWKTYHLVEKYWGHGFGYEDCLNNNLPLARMFNGLYALTYSADDYRNDNWNAPQSVLQWGRRYVRENIDDLRAMCEPRDGPKDVNAKAFWGAGSDDRVETYKNFFYNENPPARAATLIHEAHHMNREDDTKHKVVNGKKMDQRWDGNSCYAIQACYLWWFWHSGVRTTQAMKDQALNDATAIINERFIEHPFYLAGVNTQDNWRWCNKCQGLFFAGNNLGSCPAGGTHSHPNNSGSWNYQLIHNHAIAHGQDNWRWCNKCQGLFFAGNNNLGRCPAGGTHSNSGSWNYSVAFKSPIVAGQDGWRWCNKCQGLFFAGNNSLGRCPAGGTHNESGSGEYRLIV